MSRMSERVMLGLALAWLAGAVVYVRHVRRPEPDRGSAAPAREGRLAPAAEEEEWIPLDGAGRIVGLPAEIEALADRPSARDLQRIFESETDAALDRIEATLGWSLPEGRRVRMRFDAEEGGDSHPASAQGTAGRDPVVVWRLGRVERGGLDLRQAFLHEMTHALQLALQERSGAPPLWVAEGIAVHVSGEGPAHLHRLRSRLESAWVPLPSAGEPEAYAEGYLAVRFIEERFGADALREFAAGVLARPDEVENVVEEVTGLSMEEFDGRVRQSLSRR